MKWMARIAKITQWNLIPFEAKHVRSPQVKNVILYSECAQVSTFWSVSTGIPFDYDHPWHHNMAMQIVNPVSPFTPMSMDIKTIGLPWNLPWRIIQTSLLYIRKSSRSSARVIRSSTRHKPLAFRSKSTTTPLRKDTALPRTLSRSLPVRRFPIRAVRITSEKSWKYPRM